jgi:hypothetical protein
MVADISWTERHKLLSVLKVELTTFIRIRKVQSLHLGPESALFHFSSFCGSSDTLQINTRIRGLRQCRADHILSTGCPMKWCYVVQASDSFFKQAYKNKINRISQGELRRWLGKELFNVEFHSLCLIPSVTNVATSTQVFLGFPVSISKCWDGSCVSKLPLCASHVALPI